jgi:hypothetical protein
MSAWSTLWSEKLKKKYGTKARNKKRKGIGKGKKERLETEEERRKGEEYKRGEEIQKERKK